MKKTLDTPFERVYFINHSHIDHTWWDSPEACKKRNDEIINVLLDISALNPQFKFSYETTAALMEYLARYPERKEEVCGLLNSHRLDIGGLYASANADACSEETIARNFYFGKRWLEKVLRYSPRIAKEYDTPGHAFQMPQLLRSAGMDVFVISRGPHGCFYWVGPDGSEALTCCIPYNWSYWRKLGVSFDETERRMPAELERGAASFPGSSLLIPDGDDMTLPNECLVDIVRRWNEQYDRPKLALSTLDEFVDAIRPLKLPQRSGDMPNLWVGIHSLQIEATRDSKLVQNLLPTAEALHVLLSVHKNDFGGYPAEKIDSCWMRTLLVADHNWGGKDQTRHGAEGDEYKRGLAAAALRDCRRLIEDAFEGLSGMLLGKETPTDMPVFVFNPVAWNRTDVASVEVKCGVPGLEGIAVANAEGGSVPFAATVLEKHGDDTIRRARVDFLCRDLPSLGYLTYHIKPVVGAGTGRKETEVSVQQLDVGEVIPACPTGTNQSTSTGSVDAHSVGANSFAHSPLCEQQQSSPFCKRGEGGFPDRTLENRFYRVEFSEDGTCIKNLFDKELGLELAGKFKTSLGPFEFEFGMFELFGIGLKLSVPDQSFFENPENQGTGESVSPTGEVWRASDYPATVRIESNSDLSKSIIAESEFVESKRCQRVVLYDGLKRIDLHFELDWGGKPDTALYLQMPNTLMSGQKFIDVPFAVHREGNELMDFWIDESSPLKFKLRGMQDWVCFEDEGRGFAIATRWPMIDFTLVPSFPLMWTNNDSGFFFGERYLQKGKHRFSFSITSYKGSWLENRIHHWGKQWSKPLLSVIGQTEPIRRSQSYLSVEPTNIIVSAVKKAHDDAVVVRLYEITGKKTEARLNSSFPIKLAALTNLIETVSESLPAQQGFVNLSFNPFEIKNVKLYL
ncbi:MAG: hypothetical protein HY801_01300 [Candidatus Lindowbacteria bacterium]|nr:hypothetical protein [Candidatus Lindowbacteria bacterium]